MAKRIVLDQCCAVLIDVQEYFLAQLDSAKRESIEANTMGFAKTMRHLAIPVVATVEKPIDKKGKLPPHIQRYLDANDAAEIFEKEFFDLTKHKDIVGYLRSQKRKQILVGGCETDVCVLQSCLGLLNLGYEVYLVEELLFSTSRDVTSAVERLKASGAVMVSMKTLLYELLEATETSPQRKKLAETYGPFSLGI